MNQLDIPRRGQASDIGAVAARAWHDVLGCDQPAADANFFALGGHSLAAARVMSRMQPHTSIRLSVRLLFDNPVFCEFVAAVARGGSD